MHQIFTVVGIALAIVLSACGGPNGDTSFITGSELEREIARQFGEAGTGIPLAGASCPNIRLIGGDSIVCRVTFGDGSYRDMELSIKSATDGGLSIQVDIAG